MRRDRVALRARKKPRHGRCSAVAGAAALLALAAAGCARAVIVPAPSGDDPARARASEQIDGLGSGAPADESRGGLTLARTLALALMHNPDLQAASWEVRAQEAARLQAGLLPNPTLHNESEDLAGSGRFIPEVSQPQTTVRLGQLVQLGGDRQARRLASGLAAELAGWDYAATRLDVLARATRAFVELLGAQEVLRLAEESVDLAEQVAATVSSRVDAGVVSPVELTRALIEVSETRIRRDAAERGLAAARKVLALSWGGHLPPFQRAAGTLPPVSAIPSEAVLEEHLARNPDLARWTTELARRRADVDLERAQAIPDVTLTAGYRKFHDTGNNTLVVGASIPLPLFDRNQGGVAEARARLDGGELERRTAEARARRDLAEAYRILASARDEATALETDVMPGAERAFRATQEGYALGKFGFLDVLQTQRSLFAAREQHVRALVSFHGAAADVERLVGEPLHQPRLAGDAE